MIPLISDTRIGKFIETEGKIEVFTVVVNTQYNI